jgi:hypothetical protein
MVDNPNIKQKEVEIRERNDPAPAAPGLFRNYFELLGFAITGFILIVIALAAGSFAIAFGWYLALRILGVE